MQWSGHVRLQRRVVDVLHAADLSARVGIGVNLLLVHPFLVEFGRPGGPERDHDAACDSNAGGNVASAVSGELQAWALYREHSSGW